ncbi:MAG: transglycosylase domain-containing protein, partial [Acidimicrobiales bacterium]
LDARLQLLAEQERAKVLTRSITKGQFTSALASVEPSTGYVRAVVAGDDFVNAKYNLATQGKRQPGSSFKIFVLLAALDAGFSPEDTINGSSPCTLKVPGFDVYKPGNYEGTSGGTMTITQATTNSVNCAYARLGIAVGLDKVVDMAVGMGLPRDRLDPFPSISLGAEEVTPLEMASAYATIANDGVYHAPVFVKKVTDRNGKVLFQGPGRARRAFSAQTARVAIQVMRTVVDRGTGTAAKLPSRQVAGKTGTSQNYENAWFVGFTPQLATSVWMGSPIGNVAMTNVGGRKVTGGSYPARIWGAYMGKALQGTPVVTFPVPNAKLIPKGKFVKDKACPSSRCPAPSGRSRSTSTTSGPGFGEFPLPGGPAPVAPGAFPSPTPAPPSAPTVTPEPAPTPTSAPPG